MDTIHPGRIEDDYRYSNLSGHWDYLINSSDKNEARLAKIIISKEIDETKRKVALNLLESFFTKRDSDIPVIKDGLSIWDRTISHRYMKWVESHIGCLNPEDPLSQDSLYNMLAGIEVEGSHWSQYFTAGFINRTMKEDKYNRISSLSIEELRTEYKGYIDVMIPFINSRLAEMKESPLS